MRHETGDRADHRRDGDKYLGMTERDLHPQTVIWCFQLTLTERPTNKVNTQLLAKIIYASDVLHALSASTQPSMDAKLACRIGALCRHCPVVLTPTV